MTSNELSNAASLWAELFKDDDIAVVKVAVANLLQTLEFPPTIADVKKEMQKLVDTVTDKPTAIDEWNQIKKALSNSIYHAQECFDTLPAVAKAFVGSPGQLRSWATSSDFNDGVVRGQFLKQYEALSSREQCRATLTPEIVKLISNTGIKTIGEAKDNG